MVCLEAADSGQCESTEAIFLEHKTLDSKTYACLFEQCAQSNMLQSAAYGDAKCRVEGWRVEKIAVWESGRSVAIYQVILKNIPFLGTVARINRGPLYLQEEYPAAGALVRLYRSFYEEWVVKRGCYLQIAPNVPEDLMTAGDMEKTGFTRSVEPGWQSGWLCLDPSEDVLRKSLKQKWRNLLNKSEKMALEVCPVESEDDLEVVLKEYDLFMKERNFQGTSSVFIRAMYRQSPHMFYSALARKDGDYYGAIIIVKHGKAATYLMGITSHQGRKANANYLLIWNGLLHCKQAGVTWFDVGGIDEVHTAGITHFKKGLGFTPYRLVGEYEGYRGIRYGLLSRMKRQYHRMSHRRNFNANTQKSTPQGR